jgi:hypothetical protein
MTQIKAFICEISLQVAGRPTKGHGRQIAIAPTRSTGEDGERCCHAVDIGTHAGVGPAIYHT